MFQIIMILLAISVSAIASADSFRAVPNCQTILSRKTLQSSTVGAFVSQQRSQTTTQQYKNLFNEVYFTPLYEQNRCGLNIKRFIQAAQKYGLDLSSTHILRITSEGFVHLEGMRGYAARSQGPWGKSPGETVWFFHVVFAHHGYIYDFDFMNEPTVLPAAQYFKRMFYPDGFQADRYESKPGFAEMVRKYYAVEMIPTTEFLRQGRVDDTSSSYQKLSLGEYLLKP